MGRSERRELDWQIADVVVSPGRSLEGVPEGLGVVSPPGQARRAREATARDSGASGAGGGFRQRLVRLLTRSRKDT